MPKRLKRVYDIAQLAGERNLNKESLSRKADIGRTTVSRIWDNETESASIETLSKIAEALNRQAIEKNLPVRKDLKVDDLFHYVEVDD